MIDYAVIGKRIQLSRQNKGITQESWQNEPEFL